MEEHEDKRQLRRLADVYKDATGLSLSAVGKIAADDRSFFARLSDEKRTITLRTRDEVKNWFSLHWPEGTPWPSDVPRPQVAAPSTSPAGDAGAEAEHAA